MNVGLCPLIMLLKSLPFARAAEVPSRQGVLREFSNGAMCLLILTWRRRDDSPLHDLKHGSKCSILKADSWLLALTLDRDSATKAAWSKENKATLQKLAVFSLISSLCTQLELMHKCPELELMGLPTRGNLVQ